MRRMRAVPLLCLLCLLAMAGQALASETEITNSGENLRTGWYPNEPSITPQLVSGGTFGQLWSAPVEGAVYAQPLLDDGTLFVATEENKVYGLNPTTGALQWSKPLNLGPPFKAADIGCGDLAPDIGVTSTPVIDPATNTAYFTYKTYASGSSGPARWFMDAVSVPTGQQKTGFPVLLSGSAQNAPGQSFEAETELQRPGLLLMGGVVYAGFGSDCDTVPWQGWVFGVSTAGTIKARWVADETGSGAGIWQSGSGLASDGEGNILLSTGNGGAPSKPTPGKTPPTNLGESIVRLQVQSNGSLKATDFFAPYDATSLDEWDADFASGGVTGLPEEEFGTSAIPHLAVAVGKDGYVYLLNRDNLGGIGQGPSGSDDVVQRIGPYGGVWSRPGVWPGQGGWVYIPTASAGTSAGGSSGNLRVYQYGLSPTGTPALSLQATSSEAFGFSSSAPVITSNETEAGSALVWLVWAPNGGGEGAQLRAYDPIPVNGEPVLRWSAPIGTSSKFAIPGVGAGRLFVGTRDGHVLAFGSPVTPVLTGSVSEFPTTTVGQSSQQSVTLTATEPLTLSSLTSSSSAFLLGSPSDRLPATLATGQTIEVPITFRPNATGPLAATLTATTSTGKKATFALSGTGQAQAAQLEVSPPVVTFGGTSVGESLSETATIRNVGGSPLEIEKVELPAAPFYVESPPKVGSTIAPGGSVTVTIDFDPTATGKFTGQIGLDTSGGDEAVALTGSAGAPGALQITGETIEYGQVLLHEGVTKEFTITNTGGTTVTITKSKPPTGGEFTATTSLPEGTTVAPGETLTEKVEFSPTSVGAASGEWAINGNDTTGVHYVHFSGTGAAAPLPGALQVSSEALEYGSVRLGDSVGKTFTITNTGGSTVTITGSVPPSGGAFTATTSLPVGTEIAPGESVLEGVTFSPTAVGTTSAVWPIDASDATGLHEVRFSGTGVAETPASPITLTSMPVSTTVAAALGVLPSKESTEPPAPQARLASAALTANARGASSIRVHCPAGGVSCTGTVTLRTLDPVRRVGAVHAKPAILTLANGSFKVLAGHVTAVKLRLSGQGRALLARLHVLRARATVVVRGPVGAASSSARSIVTIRAARLAHGS
jgi:Abnormal spindle-like microcephaly-assoc'd, ASPM-SPD-2-Hydin/Protein of unknown function (DUF1573)/PQQ-like domain